MENINDYMPLSNDWNKERLETLKKLFPDLFTNEGKLNINELKKVVDSESVSETERYEFRWFGKSAAKRNAFSPSNATLVYDEARSVNPSETENLIIEGENLEVLKLLSTAYREKIKCIYIDPPYNTGKDFVYSDNYSQDKKAYWEDAGIVEEGLKIDTNTETDGRYHSNWLNMMYSRLLIARQLLREDGVIFISIDDNEVHHLRKLCDEVFGEENFISQFTVRSNPRGSQSSKFIALEHEYIIMYSKNVEDFEIEGYTKTDDKIDEYNLSDEKGRKFRLLGLRQRGGAWRREQRPKMYYPIYVNENTGEVSLEKNDFFTKESLPKRPSGEDGRWTWGIDKFTKNKSLLVGKKVSRNGDNDYWDIFRKDYLENEDGEIASIKVRSIWDEREINYQNGRTEIKALFGNSEIFDFPKPSFLLKKVLGMLDLENEIVLDFFGGSGTTGHAVMELNEEEDVNRKFILVQIPENTDEKSEAYKAGYKKISDITIERNKRVVEAIIEEKKNQQPDLFTNGKEDESIKNLGFKVFKLVKSNFPRVEFAPDPEKTTEENIELLKKYISEKEAQFISMFNEKELVTEVLIKNGFLLNYTLTKQEEFKKNKILFATDGEKETLICLDVLIDNETVEHFKKNTDKKFICLERALDTTKKWNLKHYLGDKFKAF